MRIIKELACMIREEVDDAEHYAECALKNKESDTKLAEMFCTLAKAELEHANLEHEQAVRLIKENTTEVPKGMMEIWEFEHDLIVSKTAEVKAMLDMYKG